MANPVIAELAEDKRRLDFLEFMIDLHLAKVTDGYRISVYRTGILRDYRAPTLRGVIDMVRKQEKLEG